MNRYEDIIDKKLDLKKKRRTHMSALPPKVEASDQDYYIIAREGDRLDNLAYEYYEDSSQWWVLAQANHLGKGTLIVPAGIRLRIPAKRELHALLKMKQAER